MFDILYNFINDYIVGPTTFEGAEQLTLLLTFASTIVLFFGLVKLVVLAFKIPFGAKYRG